MVSPVWLQVLHKGKQKYEIGGTHDIDAKWLHEVRKSGSPGKKSKFVAFSSLKMVFNSENTKTIHFSFSPCDVRAILRIRLFTSTYA